MTRRIKVRSIKRKEVDEDKLALAFLMLAKILHEQTETESDANAGTVEPRRDPEAM